jgi:hypothetical protein
MQKCCLYSKVEKQHGMLYLATPNSLHNNAHFHSVQQCWQLLYKHEYRMQDSDKQFLMFQRIYIATWYF